MRVTLPQESDDTQITLKYLFSSEIKPHYKILQSDFQVCHEMKFQNVVLHTWYRRILHIFDIVHDLIHISQ